MFIWPKMCLFFVCFSSIALTSFGCGGSNEAQQALLDNKALWQKQRLNTYSMVYEQRCFCSQNPALLKVEDEQIVGAFEPNSADPLKSDEGTPMLLSEVRGTYRTVTQVFTSLERTLDEHGDDSVRVTYHSELGYPMVVIVEAIDGVSDSGSSLDIAVIQPTASD